MMSPTGKDHYSQAGDLIIDRYLIKKGVVFFHLRNNDFLKKMGHCLDIGFLGFRVLGQKITRSGGSEDQGRSSTPDRVRGRL